MNERPESLPTVRRPLKPTPAESFIMAVSTGVQWLECASEDGYPLSVRQIWREQAATALNAAMTDCDSEMDFGSQERGALAFAQLDRAEDLWAQTVWLDAIVS